MQNSDWLDSYIDAWLAHPAAGGPDGGDALERLVAFMSPDVRYEDVPSNVVFEGHAGVAEMCAGAFQMSSDLTFRVTSAQIDGRRFAFENTSTGTNTGAVGPIPATGRPLTIRGVAVGVVSEDGLVEHHCDYWDMAGLLVQLGVLPGPAS